MSFLDRMLTSALVLAFASTLVGSASPAMAAHGVGCNEVSGRRNQRFLACTNAPSLASIRLAHCPAEICLNTARRKAFISLMDLTPGTKLKEETLSRGIARLVKTGFFRDVVPTCTVADGKTRLTLSACPNTFIRKIKIQGNRFLHRREIWKRIFLRPGIVLNASPKDPFLNAQVQNQSRTIRSLYQKEGISLAKTNCKPGVEGKDCGLKVTITRASPTTVDVMIRIRELPRKQVRTIRAQHRQMRKPHKGDLQCPRVDESNLKKIMKLSIGDAITKRKRRRMKRALKFFFQSIGFLQPKIVYSCRGEGPLLQDDESCDKDSSVFSVEVRTEICWLVRVWSRDTARPQRDIAFFQPDPVTGTPSAGPRPYKLSLFEAWRNALPFGNSGNFEADEAARGVNAIRNDLQNRGYLFADVTMNHRRLPRIAKLNTPVAGLIDYYVTRNEARRIQGISLTGVKAFKPEKVRGLLSTTSYDFFGDRGTLQTARLFNDLAKIMSFYRDRGFYQVRFRDRGGPKDSRPRRSFETEGKDAKWLVWTFMYRDRGFQVRKHKEERGVYVDIGLVEGKRTTLKSISVQNTAPLSTTKALKLLGLAPGKPFGVKYIKAGIERLKRNYQTQGYYQTTVKAHCKSGHGKTIDCRRIAELQPETVDVKLVVNAGIKAVVGEVFWRGNYRTKASILIRDLPKPGRAFSRLEVGTALRKLRNLGIFSSVDVLTIGLKEKPTRKKVALVIVVEEAPARFIDLAAGFRTIDRPDLVQGDKIPPIIGSVVGQSVSATDRYAMGSNRSFFLTIPDILLIVQGEYIDKNLLGSAVAMRIPVEYGFSATSLLRLLQTKPRWTIPRFLGTDLKLEVTGRFIFADRVSEVKDFTEFSAGITATYPFSKKMSITTEASSGVIRFEDFDTASRLGLFDKGYVPFVRLSLRWRWDNQDNPLHPTKGFALATSLSWIIAQEIVDDQVEARQFIKWDISVKGALTVRSLGVILAVFIRYGGSDATEVRPLPEQERFTLGKSNGLRGFGDKSVGRYNALGELIRPAPLQRLDFGGNVLLNFNLELRIPLSKKAGLWAVTFFDAGALAAEHSQLHFPESFRSGAGFGLRLLLLNQIPIRLDLGFVLGALRCEVYREVTPGAGLTCDRLEPRTSLHLGFLYPF